MRIKNIASGSRGNATYIGSENTHILIDTGISRKRILEGLAQAGLSLADIDAILITHEHADHISGLGVLERTREIPVYATKGTIRGICSENICGDFNTDVFAPISADEPFCVGDISVLPISTWHDANEPVCFRLENGSSSFAVVTDLGECNDYLAENLSGLSGILLEANHDVRMLEVGRYPYYLKQRILGRFGHLSNESSGRFLSGLLHDNIKYIMLGHLSEENNTKELAQLTVELEIDAADNVYKRDDFEICVASAYHPSELVCV